MTDPDHNPDTGRRTRPGRPPLLDQALTDRIAQVVKAGNYLKVAAQYAGVSYSTLQAWMARGRKAADLAATGEEVPALEQPYLTFLETVTQAETVAEVAAVTHWRAAFVNDWRAARDYLVRSKPDRWAATTRIAISNDEADARIQRATEEALTALGIDTDTAELMASDLDPTSAALDDPWADDDEEPGDD